MLFPQQVKYYSVSFVVNSSFTIAKSLIGTDIIVAGGSETEHINLFGIGRKQIGQSSLAGGSSKTAPHHVAQSSTPFALFFVLRPMILPAVGVAILDEHT
jgi:hypothetical protein